MAVVGDGALPEDTSGIVGEDVDVVCRGAQLCSDTTYVVEVCVIRNEVIWALG